MLNPIASLAYALKQNMLLEEMELAHLTSLALEIKTRNIPAGELLFQQGDTGQSIFFILQGRLAVQKVKEEGELLPLIEVAPHQVIGEISLLDTGTRSAQCIALEDASVGELSQDALMSVLATDPQAAASFLLRLNKVLANRLRKTTEDLL